MRRLRGVSRNGFYDWLGRTVSAHERMCLIIKTIKHSHEARDGTYGSPPVVWDLIDAVFSCSENRVERLMKATGTKACHKRRKAPGQLEAPVHAIVQNLLDWQFDAIGSNHRWAADYTYVSTGEGWLFVAVVLEVYSRGVVDWSMQLTISAQLVMDALLAAIFRRGRPREVLHLSDQGSQYTSEDFQRLLASHGIVCSMSRRGKCLANAAMESFFYTLKTERRSKKHYRTKDDLRADVFDRIESFYNPHRRHSSIGYISPVHFENINAPNGSARTDGGMPFAVAA